MSSNKISKMILKKFVILIFIVRNVLFVSNMSEILTTITSLWEKKTLDILAFLINKIQQIYIILVFQTL